ACTFLHGDFRHAGSDAGQHHAVNGPHRQHALLQSCRRRRCPFVSAPLLVLRASRRLHHLFTGGGDHFHSGDDLLTSSHIWLCRHRGGHHCHGVLGLWRLGAPHVRHGNPATG